MRSPVKTWFLTHLFRTWTAAATLIGLALGFFYKPEWITWWLRISMRGIELFTGALPYPWGDRLEVFLRGIGGSIWIQITVLIVLVRIIVWVMMYVIRGDRPADRT